MDMSVSFPPRCITTNCYRATFPLHHNRVTSGSATPLSICCPSLDLLRASNSRLTRSS